MSDSLVQYVGGVAVRVERKNVKHLHLSVHPPEGNVRAVVPINTKADKVRLFIVSRLGWIRRRRRKMNDVPRRQVEQFTEGESVFLWGKQYRLRLCTTTGKHRVVLSGDWLELHIRKGTDRKGRRRLLYRYYREELAAETKRLARKWEAATDLHATEYRIRLMHAKWGSCNVEARRVWLNVELARHSPACLSYILLHELLHLRERGHTDAFRALITQHLPGWRNLRTELNEGFPGLPILKPDRAV